MRDPIERQDAIDAMTTALWHYPNECYRNLNEYEFAKGLAEIGLKSVPSAQPEIIRCKDCKHYGGRPCGIVDWYNTADDFCSRVERSEDVKENGIQ